MPNPTQLGITRPESKGLSSILYREPSTEGLSSIESAANALRLMNANTQRYAPTPVYSSFNEARRYDDPILKFNPNRVDQEDLYAQNQGWGESLFYGLGRIATTTLTKTGSSLGFLGAAFTNMFGGNGDGNFEDRMTNWMSRTSDNAFSKWFDSIEDDIKQDYMPIYQDAADRNKGFFSRALTDLTFWTDEFSDGAAFMLSAFLPGMAISKIGLGARAVRGLNRIGFGRNIGMTDEAARVYNEGLKTASSLSNNYEALSTVPRVAKWISNAKLARNIDVGTQTFLSTAAESMVEAHETKTKVAQSLEGKINPDTGIYYTGDEINKIAGEAALGTFKGNMAALALSNLWEANLLFKRLPSTSAAAGNAVKFEEGLAGAANFVKPNYIKQFGKKAAEGIVAEGFWEENVQLAISRFNESKASPTAENRKYSSSVLDNLIQGTIGAITGEDKEAALSIGLGGILGGIVGGSLSTKADRAKDKVLNNQVTQYSNIAASFRGLKDLYEKEEVEVDDIAGNKVKATRIKRDEDGKPILNQKVLDDFKTGVIERTHLLELMNNAKDSNNESLANMYENELFSQLALAHFQMGNAEGLMEKLTNIQNISDEDLALFGFDPTQKEQAFTKLTELKNRATKLQNLYDDVQRNVLDNRKNPAISELRKKKLYELGARQLFLIEEMNKSKVRTPLATTNYSLVNELIANERAAAKRVEGLTILSDSIGEIEEDVINQAEEDLDNAKKATQEFLSQNKELTKGLKKDANGYMYDPTDNQLNMLAHQKMTDELENLAGLTLALKETTNRFNKIADIRQGDKYAVRYELQSRTDLPENYAAITEADVDVNNLNNKLKVLLQNVRYDELTKDVPQLTDQEMPLVQRLEILQRMADEGSEKAKEILDEFSDDVDQALEEIEKEKKIRENVERQRQIDEEAANNESGNDGDNKQGEFEEKAKKDITDIASTVPVDADATNENNNYHLRHESFLDKFTRKSFKDDRSKHKVILVTRKNQDKLGLSGLITHVPAGSKASPDIEAKKADIERRRQEELNIVNNIPLDTNISLNDFNKLGIINSSLFGQSLFNSIINIANQFDIKIRFTNGVKELSEGAAAYFDSNSGTVLINLQNLYESYQNTINNKGRAKGTMLGVKGINSFNDFINYTVTHELIHGVTQSAYNDVFTNTRKGVYSGKLNEIQVNAVKSIGAIFNYLKTLNTEQYFGGVEYGLHNMSELMAEMSNEGFVSALERIQLPENLRYNSKNKNIFENIISFIRDLFTGKKVENNAAQSLFAAISDIITSPQIQSFTESNYTQNSTSTVQDKINAKYDAELAALPTSPSSSIDYNNEVIAAVHVIDEGDGNLFFVDADGNKLTKVSEPADIKQVIYSQLASTETKVKGTTEDRYRNESQYDEAQIAKWWGETRKSIIENESVQIFDFNISNGRLNPKIWNPEKQQGLISSGLVTEDELDDDIIEVAIGNTMAVKGAVAPVNAVSKVTKGAVYLNKDNNIQPVFGRQFNEAEINNIFRLLQKFAEDLTESKEDVAELFKSSPIKDYLNRILFFQRPEEGQVPTRNQIWIQNGLRFVDPDSGTIRVVYFSKGSIKQNEALIKNFLRNAYHQVDSLSLTQQRNAATPVEKLFIQPVINEDGSISTVDWKSYNHYLLSEKNPDGSARTPVVTLPITKPAAGEPYYIQRYIKPVGEAINLDLTKIKQDAEKAQKLAEEAALKKEKGKKPVSPKGFVVFKYNTSQGNELELKINISKGIKNITPDDIEVNPESKGFYDQLDALSQIFGSKFDTQVENEKQNNPELDDEQAYTAGGTTLLRESLAAAIQEGKIKLPVTEDVSEDKKGETPSAKPEGVVKNDGTVTGYSEAGDGKFTSEEKEALNDLLKNAGVSGIDSEDMIGRSVLEDIYNTPYVIADINAEEKWFKQRFPNVEFNKLKDIIRTTQGTQAWGMLHNAAVYIYENAEEGTTYHEAFEVVWNMFLNGKEQLDLYKEFANRKGSFRTYKGEYKTFASASVKEAKEQMAEEFRDYILSGKKPEGKVQLNIFQRIWNWIVNFFKRSENDPQFAKNLIQLFEKIDEGTFADYPIVSSYDHSSVEYRWGSVKEAPEVVVQHTLQGMTTLMFSQLFQEDQSLVHALEEGTEGAYKGIYDKVFESLKREFEVVIPARFAKMINETNDSEKKAKYGKDLLAIVKGDGQNGNPFGWKFIQDNWDLFIEDHKRYLKSFDIVFEKDEEGSEIIAELDSDESSQNRNEYTKDDFSLNVKNSASKYIKLLFATMAESEFSEVYNERWERFKDITKNRENLQPARDLSVARYASVLRLAKLVNYGKTFNYILHNTANSTSIYGINNRLMDMAADPRIRKNANIYRLLQRLKFFNQSFAGKTPAQVKGLLKFENTLLKQKPTFFEQKHLRNGEVQLYKSNFSTKTRETAREWIENLKAAPITKVTQNNMFQFTRIPEMTGTSAASIINFAQAIGIKQLDEPTYNALTQNDKTKLISLLNTVKTVLVKAVDKPMLIVSGKSTGIMNRLEEIADLLMNKVLAEDNESQHLNNDGKPTGNFVLNNWVSTVLNTASEVVNIDAFISRMPWFDPKKGDVFHRDSRLINDKVFTVGGTKGAPITLSVSEGVKSDRTGNKSIGKLSIGERVLYEFNNNLAGIYNVLVPADAKTEWVINSGTYLPITLYGNSLKREEVKKDYFYNVMRGYLATEIALAKDYKNRKYILDLTRKGEDGREVGKSLRFFKGILDPKTVNEIHTRVIDGKEKLSDVISDEQIDGQVTAYIKSRMKSTGNLLIKYGYIKKSGESYILKGFVTQQKNSILGPSNVTNLKGVEDLLAFREMNYILNNIEMHKAFFGDPAQYKDAEKRIKSFLSGRESTHFALEDGENGLNNWANTELNKDLKPEDIGYHKWKNHLNSASIFDIISSSDEETLELLRKFINPKLAQKFEKNNEADAASYMMPGAYREFLWKAGGRFTDAQENLFQWHMAFERFVKSLQGKYTYSSSSLQSKDRKLLQAGNINELTPETLKQIRGTKPRGTVFHTLKPIVSGIVFEGKVAKTDLIKTATMPLFYEWIIDTQLEQLYDGLQEKGIDLLSTQSAHKVGLEKTNTVTLYNDEGHINVQGIRDMELTPIPFRNIGIQVETSGQKEDTTQGSQLNKLDLTDIYSDGVPVDFKPEITDISQRIVLWDALTYDERIAISPLHRKAEELTQAKRDLTEIRYKNLLREWDIKEADGQFIISEKGRKKVAEAVLSELERRNLPRNIVQAIESGNMDFETIATYKQIRDIIYSIVDKRIVRPKVYGAPHVQIPVTGWGVKRTKVNKKNVYVSDKLKFYSKDNKGNTQACQILLPSKFRGIPLEKIDKELLKGIGFRIPTQGLNSVEYFEVAGFLPEDMGDVVVFPSEITTKAGSDFDIDKMNLYLKNWYKDSKGNAVMLKWQGSEEATKQYIRDIFRNQPELLLTKEQIKEATEYMAQGMDVTANKLIDSIFQVDEIPSGQELMDMYLDEKVNLEKHVDMFYLKVLENKYIDSLTSVISDPVNFGKLVSPNTQDFMTDGSLGLKEIAKRIKRLLTPKNQEVEEENSTDYSRLIDSTYMTNTRHNFLVGKGGVGIAAVSNTNNIINQLARVRIPLSQVLTLKGLGKKNLGSISLRMNTYTMNDQNYASLGSIFSNGSLINIANAGSQFIDGFVDIAKGSWIVDMGSDDEMASTFLLMNKLGINPYTYTLFLNQPSVRQFIENRKMNEAQVSSGITFRRLSLKQNYDDVRKMFKHNSTVALRPNVFEDKQMEEMIEAVANGQELTDYQKDLQNYILEDFIFLDSLRWKVFNFIQGYNYDTQKINDPNLHERKLIQTDIARNTDSNVIQGLDNVLNRSFIGAVKTAVDNLNIAISESFFRLHRGRSKKVLNELIGEVKSIKRLSLDKFKSLMDKAETNLLNYLIQNSNEINGKPISQYTKDILIYDKKSPTEPVAFWIDRLKADKHPTLAENEFLKRLVPIIDKRQGYPSVVVMNESVNDVNTSDVLTESFRELYNNYNVYKSEKGVEKTIHSIMENLIIAGILQQGVYPARSNFVPLIPEDIYNKYVTKVVDRDASVQFFKDADLFYRLNWNEESLVPTVPPYTTDDVEEVKYYPFHKGTGLLILDDYAWADKKFVKTVTYPIDPTTKQPNYQNPIVTLYKRVDTPEGEAYVRNVVRMEDGEPVTRWDNTVITDGKVFYRQAIKYGSQYIQELPTTLRTSILPSNSNVLTEMSDLDARKLLDPQKIEQLTREYLGTVETDESDIIDDDIQDETDNDKDPFTC